MSGNVLVDAEMSLSLQHSLCLSQALSCLVTFSVLKVVDLENARTCTVSYETGAKEWSLRVPGIVLNV